MAIGLARMFSIKFPVNFNSPYKAASIIDFWARWHMTLTRYLTAYLYNPISLSVNRARLKAGKRVSQKSARSPSGFLSMIAWPTLLTMSLAGIWHGAGSQFIIFGLLHGVYISVNHAWRLYRGLGSEHKPVSIPTRAAFVLLTYFCVLVAQVLFRANNTREAFQFLGAMAGMHGPTLFIKKPLVSAIVAGLIACWFLPNTQEILGQAGQSIRQIHWRWLAWKPTFAWSFSLGIIFFVCLLCIRNASTFLYFQF
jgi:D-alanyl-lipoteichoic acid acyltransferase DltB (MBOAT superfamily)